MHSSGLPYRWAFRRFWWVLLVTCGVGGFVVPALDSSQVRTYEATSLIVAQRFSQTVVALPKYGQTIFTDGAVGATVARELGIDGQDLIPSKLSADTPQDSLVFSVTGRDPDPRRAAQLATVGAKTFVAELNKGGESVGVFAVQSEARVPTAPVSPALGRPVSLAIGLTAGVVFGLGVLVLVVLLRRPLITPDDVAEQLELPGLGVLTLPPRGAGPGVLPEDAPGTTRLTRQVLASGVSTILLVSEPADAAARQQTGRVLALALSAAADVVFLGEPAMEREVNELIRQRRLARPVDESHGEDDRMIVVDVFSLLDTLGISRGKWGAVLVGPAGSSRARFDRLLGDFQHNELIGVVLYRRRRRRHRVLAAVGPAAVVAEPSSK